MPSQLLQTLTKETGLLAKTYLGFASRQAGNYTQRQLSSGAAYTVFCHAELETYFEGWAREFVDLTLTMWNGGLVSRPLVHLCSFHESRGDPTTIPQHDVWSESVIRSIRKQQDIIAKNNGIKEPNLCRLFMPIGFDVRKIDPILLADLAAFSAMRGSHAHQAHSAQLATVQDPFDRKSKVDSLLQLISTLDNELVAYLATA